MRDEPGSCAPGSFTAVALFYIYGAAAGPAVARCESHDSSAGNRDGPVIQAPHRLHVTPPSRSPPQNPPALLLEAHRSHQHQAVCPQTHAHAHTHKAACTCTHLKHAAVLFLLWKRGPHLFSGTLSVSSSHFINPSTSFLSFF